MVFRDYSRYPGVYLPFGAEAEEYFTEYPV